MFNRNTIFTYGDGTPFDRPEPPARDAGIDAWITYHRALCDYNDAIAACANRAFDEQFRKSLREQARKEIRA